MGERNAGGMNPRERVPAAVEYRPVDRIPADYRATPETSAASDGTCCIPAPCHNIQPNTPPERIVHLYETARQYGAC